MSAPKPATFDLLDADLTAHAAKYAGMSPAEHLAMFRCPDIVFSPHFWKTYGPDVERMAAATTWNEVKFKDLPDHLHKALHGNTSTGVYMFVARPTFRLDGLPGLVYYVGIAGEGGSGRPLRDRLKDYLHFEKIKKRARVHQALRLYYDVTYVRYALVPPSGPKLEDLEQALHGFLYPFASDRDFPAEIQQGRKAW